MGFDATSPRFTYNQVFYGQSLKLEVPGPGLYQEKRNVGARPMTFSQPRTRALKPGAVFNTSERRFKVKGQNSIYNPKGTQAYVGPGSYINNENSLLKKSYNMTMEHCYFV